MWAENCHYGEIFGPDYVWQLQTALRKIDNWEKKKERKNLKPGQKSKHNMTGDRPTKSERPYFETPLYGLRYYVRPSILSPVLPLHSSQYHDSKAKHKEGGTYLGGW